MMLDSILLNGGMFGQYRIDNFISMEILNLNNKNSAAWDTFCLESDDAWYLHTYLWQEFILNYNPDLESKSLSFFVEDEKKIVAICPLIVEKKNSVFEFSFGGDYCPRPALSNNLSFKYREKIMKLIFEQVDLLALDYNISRASFRFPVLNKSFLTTEQEKNNYLMKFGYLDTSINTQILDLRKPLTELRAQMRHGHDSDIVRAEKFLSAEIFDMNNITKEIFDLYVGLHAKASGRVTRPAKTFSIMFETIKSGKAFLIGSKYKELFVGFAYFVNYKNNTSYGSSCNDPDIRDLPIAHFIQWTAIKYMKSLGVEFYELGWQQYTSTLVDSLGTKQINISLFKRGFGGFTVPLFRAEKFFHKDFFLATYESRIKKYSELIN